MSSLRFLLAGLLAVTTLAQAQPASAPASAAAPAVKPAAPAPAAPPAAPAADASSGKIAYYGRKFAGRKTASGERFNPQAMTMAHKSLPFGTMVKVTRTRNDRSVVVRVNDRGPSTPDRVGDVSLAAAKKLRMVRAGVVEAKFDVVGEAKPRKAARKR